MAKGFVSSIEDEMRKIRERNETINTALSVAYVHKRPERLLIGGTYANPVILDNVSDMGWFQDKHGDIRTFRVDEHMWHIWVEREVIRAIQAPTDIWYATPNSDNDADMVDTLRKLEDLHNMHIRNDLRSMAETGVWGHRTQDGDLYLYPY